MDRAFLRALHPAPYRILGIELRPFSLGHSLLLHDIGSPFVAEELREFTVHDLFIALSICALPYEKGKALGEDAKGWKKKCDEWVAKNIRHNCGGLWSRLWRIARGKPLPDWDIANDVRAFFRYLSEGNARPDYKAEPGNDMAFLYSPWQLRMMVKLRREFGMTRSEILDMPLAEAWWMYLGAVEADGSIQICTEDEKEFVDELTR